jgi:hypothetical protein
MKVHREKHRLHVTDSDLSGMTIDGIEVTDLLAAWKERQAGQEGQEGAKP